MKKNKGIDVYKVDQRGDVVEELYLEYDELIKQIENKKYFYNEIKQQYYKLYFDIDYHYKYSFIKNYDDYTNKIINIIINVLNKIFVNPNTLYIYGKKDTGNGVHLYFNNIVVTQKIHTYILNEIYLYFINIEKVLLKYVKQIIDYHVICNGTLRLFYFNFKNGYYYPSVEKSSYSLMPLSTPISIKDVKIISNAKEYLIYSIIKTDKKMHDKLTPYYYNTIKKKPLLLFCKFMLPRL